MIFFFTSADVAGIGAFGFRNGIACADNDFFSVGRLNVAAVDVAVVVVVDVVAVVLVAVDAVEVDEDVDVRDDKEDAELDRLLISRGTNF